MNMKVQVYTVIVKFLLGWIVKSGVKRTKK